VKYSPEGGEVRLAVRRERESAAVSVSDQGIGIASDKLGLLFRPFSRVHDREATGIEGFGLGLSICERIARAHGGGFDVESTPGEGSTFTLNLPLFGGQAQSHAPVVVVAAADAITRREIRRVAEEAGFVVEEAADGVEAVEAAARLLPAAVVLDRILPRLRADEVAERLRAQEATRDVPLIALAVAADLGSHASLFRTCLARPLDRTMLEAALEGLGAAVN
jgi:CheY-like chemotaxis protein